MPRSRNISTRTRFNARSSSTTSTHCRAVFCKGMGSRHRNAIRFSCTTLLEMSAPRLAIDLDRLFHLSLDLLAVAGFDGYFKRVSPSCERMLGYTEKELMSKPYLDFVHPDDRQ